MGIRVRIIDTGVIGKKQRLALERSFIYNINNTEPKIEPWGTPHLLIRLDEQVWLN